MLAATAIAEVGAAFGQVIGIALLGSPGGVLYARNLGVEVPPATLPDGADEAYQPVANAWRLCPNCLLATAAREGFTLGLNASAATAGLLVALLLRHVRS